MLRFAVSSAQRTKYRLMARTAFGLECSVEVRADKWPSRDAVSGGIWTEPIELDVRLDSRGRRRPPGFACRGA